MDQIKGEYGIPMRGLGIATVAMAALITLTGSCLFGTTTSLCEQYDLRCPAGQVCAVNQAACIVIGGCGDGHRTGDEVCDDGNVTDGDGCNHDCTSTETCGNLTIDQGENCDDGNLTNGDGCSSQCLKEACGNGVRDPGEICDDGNTLFDDGCSANCKSNEVCGNGTMDDDGPGGLLHEECEFTPATFPLPPSDTALCDSDCTKPMCGDGHFNSKFSVTDAGPVHLEQCDTGVMGIRTDSPSCDSDCTFVQCGDGYTNMAAGEECDKGSGNSNQPDAACRKDCHKQACGDGIIDIMHNELCDDGNSDTSDGCPDGPGGSCKPATCGDGFVRTTGPNSEACDTGDPNSCGTGFVCNNNCSNCVSTPTQ